MQSVSYVFSILNFKKKFEKKIFYYANYTSYFTMTFAKKMTSKLYYAWNCVRAKAKIVRSCYEKSAWK